MNNGYFWVFVLGEIFLEYRGQSRKEMVEFWDVWRVDWGSFDVRVIIEGGIGVEMDVA